MAYIQQIDKNIPMQLNDVWDFFEYNFQYILKTNVPCHILFLVLKATNRGPQWYSDNMMQTLNYLGTSWYFNTKSYISFHLLNSFHKQKCPGKK